MNATHKLGNWVLKTTMNVLFFMNLKDSQSGMWVFRKEILRKIKLTSDGMPLSEEIKVEAWRRGLRAREYKIRYRPRIGEIKLNTWGDGFKNLFFFFTKRLS